MKAEKSQQKPMQNSEPKGLRIAIINTVQTPLGFFVLVVLIVEVIFGIISGLAAGSDRTYLIFGMLGLIFLLVLIVWSTAIFRPEALYGKRQQVVNSPPVRQPGDKSSGHRGDIRPFEDVASVETPVVIKTDPEPGALVDPSKGHIRVTFSTEMRTGWSYVTAAEGDFPEIIGQPELSPDKKTYTIQVSLKPNRTYALWFNSIKFRNFTGVSSKPAVPYFLSFRTGDVSRSCPDASRSCPMDAN